MQYDDNNNIIYNILYNNDIIDLKKLPFLKNLGLCEVALGKSNLTF